MLRHIASAVMVTASFAISSVHAAGTGADAAVYDDYGAIEASLTGTPGDAAAGALHMEDRGLGNCAACHIMGTLPHVEFQGTIGPALDGAADRWTEAELRGIVADAKQTFPETMMPSFYKTQGYIRPGIAFTSKPATEPLEPLLTAQQVEDIVAYLMTMTE